VRVESNTSRRRSTYEYQPRSPEKTRHLERSAEEYQSARARATSSQPLTNEALYQQQRIRRGAGSTSSRASGSLDGSEVKQSRNGSGATANIDNSGDGITMRFTPGTDVMFDFSGGMDGQTISLKPGQTGQQAELSIKSRKGYENRSTGTYSEYARSDQPPRESDDGRRTRDGRSGNHHRRASRVARDH
jgi:ribosomal protein S6E (S10)